MVAVTVVPSSKFVALPLMVTSLLSSTLLMMPSPATVSTVKLPAAVVSWVTLPVPLTGLPWASLALTLMVCAAPSGNAWASAAGIVTLQLPPVTVPV